MVFGHDVGFRRGVEHRPAATSRRQASPARPSPPSIQSRRERRAVRSFGRQGEQAGKPGKAQSAQHPVQAGTSCGTVVRPARRTGRHATVELAAPLHLGLRAPRGRGTGARDPRHCACHGGARGAAPPRPPSASRPRYRCPRSASLRMPRAATAAGQGGFHPLPHRRSCSGARGLGPVHGAATAAGQGGFHPLPHRRSCSGARGLGPVHGAATVVATAISLDLSLCGQRRHRGSPGRRPAQSFVVATAISLDLSLCGQRRHRGSPGRRPAQSFVVARPATGQARRYRLAASTIWPRTAGSCAARMRRPATGQARRYRLAASTIWPRTAGSCAARMRRPANLVVSHLQLHLGLRRRPPVGVELTHRASAPTWWYPTCSYTSGSDADPRSVSSSPTARRHQPGGRRPPVTT